MAVVPCRITFPSSIRAFSRSRDRSGISIASARSSGMTSQPSEMMVLMLEALEFTSYDIEINISISRALLNRILADASKDRGAESSVVLLGQQCGISKCHLARNSGLEG